MATANRSTRRAVPGQNKLLTPNPVEFSFTQDNNPNPDVLLPSLRYSGYTLETAVGDLVDNPLDKNASTVLITIDKEDDEWTVSVADDGVGMDFETLDQMMRLGSRAEHDLSSDLGAFGLGSTTASLALGTLQHVITVSESWQYLSAATDLEQTIMAGKFVKHLDIAKDAEVQLFADTFKRWGLPVPPTGTVVRVTKCDRIGRKSLEPAVKSVKSYVSSTYRHFIWAGIRFIVNGDTVDAHDPLERNAPGTHILLDEQFPYTYPSGHPKAGQTEMIGAILVQLQDWGGVEANREHGYTISSSGFYIMRNRREIVPHETLNLYARHNALNRFRGELLFPATMDADLGVKFIKSAWDVKPTQSLHDCLQQIASPYVRQARRDYNRSLTNSGEQVSHEEAAKVIRQRAPFLRRPETVIEKRAPRVQEGTERPEGETPKTRGRDPQEPRTQKALASIAEFRVRDLGPTAPIYEADLDKQKVIVTYNGQHPFYTRYILENRDNPAALTAIDYFVYSLATAEIRTSDDDTAKFIERIREDASFNLRQLLTT